MFRVCTKRCRCEALGYRWLQAAVRCFSVYSASARVLNQPRSGNEMCRAGGPNTFMRLPSADLYDNPLACRGLDVAVVGIPLDAGTSFRTGCRARTLSVLPLRQPQWTSLTGSCLRRRLWTAADSTGECHAAAIQHGDGCGAV